MSNTLFAQLVRPYPAIGNWAYHLPLNKGKNVIATKDLIYSSATAGFFYFDKSLGLL